MIFLNRRHLGALFAFIILLGNPVLAGDLMLGPLQFRATVEGLLSSGAYLSIKNNGEVADRLLDVTSDLAHKTELHEIKISNGVMKMRQVIDGIKIPAGETVDLKPGGYHVMLMSLKAPLYANNIFEITLIFESAGNITVKGMAKRPADLAIVDSSILPKDRTD